MIFETVFSRCVRVDVKSFFDRVDVTFSHYTIQVVVVRVPFGGVKIMAVKL